ncbi:Golgi-associated protein/Nedd4 WW domain-binding protein [Phaffia rhodozyma]|uniref:Golgi-associated protein/Nedd4 WW domain-binding protein n=1 Tax=Phaffia rhodozyma TaxID=264483 RepID=A0A0F7SST6_PHARH|nr:Golgi-associated protein/Nedd4 WW domain-binding protein [Phaffia rhodozyma]
MSRYSSLPAGGSMSNSTSGSPSYPPRASNHDQEMEAAFDDSDEESGSEDENAPLSRSKKFATNRSGSNDNGNGRGDRIGDNSSSSSTTTIGGGGVTIFDAGEDSELPPVDESSALGGNNNNNAAIDPARMDLSTMLREQNRAEQNTDGESSYDFDRDYFLPPPGSPPPGAYPENYMPTGPTPLLTTPSYPRPNGSSSSGPSRFFRSILPTHFVQSNHSAAASAPRGSDGVWANLNAKPEPEQIRGEGATNSDGDNTEVMAEFSSKDGPPAYNIALRDAVPPYWEHNVLTPSFGPLGSIATSGDTILIDSLPVGTLFSFLWSLLVSVSFQFIGFLLTYVLHQSHAAKFGSRAGLGLTLIQYGWQLRGRALDLENGIDPDGIYGPHNSTSTAAALSDRSWAWPGGYSDTGVPLDPHTTMTSASEARPTGLSWSPATGWTSSPVSTSESAAGTSGRHPEFNQPTMEEVGQANEWLSFVLMTVGWFVLLTSLGGYWRVHRYEKSLLSSQDSTSDEPAASGLSRWLLFLRSSRSRSTSAEQDSATASDENPSAGGALPADRPSADPVMIALRDAGLLHVDMDEHEDDDDDDSSRGRRSGEGRAGRAGRAWRNIWGRVRGGRASTRPDEEEVLML